MSSSNQFTRSRVNLRHFIVPPFHLKSKYQMNGIHIVSCSRDHRRHAPRSPHNSCIVAYICMHACPFCSPLTLSGGQAMWYVVIINTLLASDWESSGDPHQLHHSPLRHHVFCIAYTQWTPLVPCWASLAAWTMLPSVCRGSRFPNSRVSKNSRWGSSPQIQFKNSAENLPSWMMLQYCKVDARRTGCSYWFRDKRRGKKCWALMIETSSWWDERNYKQVAALSHSRSDLCLISVLGACTNNFVVWKIAATMWFKGKEPDLTGLHLVHFGPKTSQQCSLKKKI